MKKIIVATDFSKASLHAVKYAVEMAQVIQAELVLFHVLQIPINVGEVPIAVNEKEMRQDAENELSKIKNGLIEKTNGKLIIKTVVVFGAFFQELKTVCENVMPYVVIMGSQGTSALDHLLFGNHTIHAMRNLEWPLITVPLNTTYSNIKKIGLACDLNEEIDSVQIDEIKKLVIDFKASLHVINTSKAGEYNPKNIPESITLKNKLKPIIPVFHFIADKKIDEGIIKFTEENNVDLLIMLPKRHSLLDKLIHKSHTKKMVLHSPVPVLALHHS